MWHHYVIIPLECVTDKEIIPLGCVTDAVAIAAKAEAIAAKIIKLIQITMAI